MNYNINRAKDGPRDEDGIAHGGEDVIADPEMDSIEVDDSDGSHSKDCCRAGVGGDAERWWHLRAFFVSEMTRNSRRAEPVRRPSPSKSIALLPSSQRPG